MTRALGWLTVLGLVTGLAAGFGYAPREAVQGNVQRIMYLHVPAVLTAYLAFVLVLAGSIGYLATRRSGWDRLAAAAGEIGVLFTGLTIVSGSIWGKPTWGTWWTWDARLTSTAVLFCVYVGYLLLRSLIEEWWRALHQPSTILGPERSPIDPAIGLALFVNWVAFTLLFAYFLSRRMEIARLEEQT